MNFFIQILILAIVQGACELLPVSSSAHVIVAEKLMGLDPSTPAMTFLLVLLHTGTMFAVIVYFWKAWRAHYFSSAAAFQETLKLVAAATVITVMVGGIAKEAIEKVGMKGVPHAEIESLFSNLLLVGVALFAVGILILMAGAAERRGSRGAELGLRESCWIGAVQGLCLPFRGFSRSGATISTGLLLGSPKQKLEEFSFALAVVLTPLVIGAEAMRLRKATAGGASGVLDLVKPGLVGMVFSFVAGLLALRLLSRFLEGGRWQLFGYYCIVASGVVLFLHFRGF